MVGEKNPTKQDTGFGGIAIRRLAPGDRSIQVEWELTNEHSTSVDEYAIQIWCADDEVKYKLHLKAIITVNAPSDTRSTKISGIFNGVDYAIVVSAIREGKETARSRTRLFRAGPLPGTVVAYIHPEDYTFDSSGRSSASLSLIRLPSGRLLASHDIFWHHGGQNITHVYSSDDDGATWSFLTEVTPCFWGKLFIHCDIVYLLCTSTEYGDLQIYRSFNSGASFEGPFVLIKGDGRIDFPGPHKAPVPVVLHKGRLWTAVEYGCWKQGYHDTGVISAPADADLCRPESWTLSPFISYDPSWPDVIKGGNPSVLEGNIVQAPDGGLVNILRYQTSGGIPEYGKAIMLRVDDEHPAKPQTFEACIDFPGNLSKFDVYRDEKTGLYISLVNRAHLPWYIQRNILSLSISKDLKEWRIVCDLINYEDKEWPEGALHVGFQYVDFFIDGSDVLYLSRTALNGAHNFHDANHITFHRIEDFRNLFK